MSGGVLPSVLEMEANSVAGGAWEAAKRSGVAVTVCSWYLAC